MNIRPEHLEAIRRFGYTEAEARFLYIVAVHSGYFTQRQFAGFIESKPGRAVHAFVEKASAKRHFKQTVYRNNSRVYQLSYRPIYESIQKENIRNRREHSLEFIKTRLAILDFVLAHLDCEYLEGEQDKVRYFEENFNIDRKDVPGRTYKGSNHTPCTIRYFVDKFPMFLDRASDPQQSVPTFTYVDPGFENVKGFRLDLEAYAAFLGRLPGFAFIYACPLTRTFHSAERAFRDIVDAPAHLQPSQAVRYFRVRSAWAAKRYGTLTNDDIEFLNKARNTFAGDAIESLYANWSAGCVTDDQLTPAFRSLLGTKRTLQFSTYNLPYDYSQFDQNSRNSGKPNANRFSERFSDRFSAAEALKSK
ncbi:MAG TPA: hypothetical protein VLV31_05625 [Candidatus Acidoferrales bacterium]|nr:hypothetical protein [Candidatus Acidoferrales bacterium]